MKKKLALGALLLPLCFIATAADNASLSSEKEKFSYGIGFQIGQQLRADGMDVDAEAVSQALKDTLKGEKPKFTMEEMQAAAESMQKKRVAQQQAAGDKNMAAGKAFLEKNKTAAGVTTLPSGIQYKVITKGNGKSPAPTDQVSVHYRGTLVSGVEFDSSYKRNQPATFPVNQVIKGWQEILPMMKEGDKWEVTIPSDLAYGPPGRGGAIGPNETLIFEIELLSIKK